MIVVLSTRIAERRRASRPAGAAAALVGLALLAAAPARAQVPPLPARRRRRGAAPPARAARRARHAARHARARGGLERDRQAERLGGRPRGDGPRLGPRAPGLGDPADRAREGRPPRRRDRPPARDALVLLPGPGPEREAQPADGRRAVRRAAGAAARASREGGPEGGGAAPLDADASSTRTPCGSCPRRSPATRGRPPSTSTPSPTSARCSTPASPPGASRPSGSRSSCSTTGPAPPASRGGC